MNVAPSPGCDSTASEPPCASAKERARKSPRPVPGFALPGGATELLEDLILVLRSDAGTRVPDSHDHVAVVRLAPDADLRAGVRVLDGVRDQVVDQLPQPFGVPANVRQRCRQLGASRTSSWPISAAATESRTISARSTSEKV